MLRELPKLGSSSRLVPFLPDRITWLEQLDGDSLVDCWCYQRTPYQASYRPRHHQRRCKYAKHLDRELEPP
jgi:hypothetical protein